MRSAVFSPIARDLWGGPLFWQAYLCLCGVSHFIHADHCGSLALTLANLCGFLSLFSLVFGAFFNPFDEIHTIGSQQPGYSPECWRVLRPVIKSSDSTVVSSNSASSSAEHVATSIFHSSGFGGDFGKPTFPGVSGIGSTVTVKASLAAERSASAFPAPYSAAALTGLPVLQVGGVPGSNGNLPEGASALFDAGVGFSSARVGPPVQSAQGRLSCVFPSFVCHFFHSAPLPRVLDRH